MIEVDATLFTLLAEGFALACVVLLGTWVYSVRRNGRDRKALRALVADINEEAAARLERTRTLLEDGERAAALTRHERGVCQAFIGVYDKRAADALSSIYTALKALVDAYQAQLETAQEAVRGAAPAAAASPKDAVIAKLKQDYEQAASELQITKQTMEKMLCEYNSMFAGGSDSDSETDTEAELEAEEILQMLETGRHAATPLATADD